MTDRHLDKVLEKAMGRSIREALGYEIIAAIYADECRRHPIKWHMENMRMAANRIMRA